MPIKIKNWKLALLALIFFCLFIALGVWQLSRAHEKQALLDAYADRSKNKPLSTAALKEDQDLRFYRISLHGTFDNEHTVLLDNKIHDQQIGYEVYTPFHADGLNQPILIDRGFINMGKDRRTLPAIRKLEGSMRLTGMLNLPPKYVAFGQITESNQISWPLRVEYIHLIELSKYIGKLSTPYVVQMDPKNALAYPIKWEIVIMSPDKHMGYAVQWFAFAATLLILFVALNRQ